MCPSTSNTPDTLRFEVNDEIPLAFTVVTETPLVPTVKPPVKEVEPVTSRSSATLTLPLPSPDNVRFVSDDLEIIESTPILFPNVTSLPELLVILFPSCICNAPFT